MSTTGITVEYQTIHKKTGKGCSTFNQKLTTTLIKLIKLNIKTFQLIESTKNNLKIAEQQIVQGVNLP